MSSTRPVIFEKIISEKKIFKYLRLSALSVSWKARPNGSSGLKVPTIELVEEQSLDYVLTTHSSDCILLTDISRNAFQANLEPHVCTCNSEKIFSRSIEHIYIYFLSQCNCRYKNITRIGVSTCENFL